MEYDLQTIELFKGLIREIVDEQIKKYISNYGETVYDGQVSISEDNTIIDLGFTKMKATAFPNKSGETLNDGDMVRIYAKNGSLSNAYIGVKF